MKLIKLYDRLAQLTTGVEQQNYRMWAEQVSARLKSL